MLSHHPAYFSEAWDMDDVEAAARRGIPSSVDTLIGRGMSGAVVVPRLAERLGLKWAIIRKNDGSHSFTNWLGDIGDRWAFVDDFIDSGDTLRATMEGVRAAARRAAKELPVFEGSFLYSEPSWVPPNAHESWWDPDYMIDLDPLDPLEA